MGYAELGLSIFGLLKELLARFGSHLLACFVRSLETYQVSFTQ